MTDLRKAAELALEALEEYCITRTITRPIASSDALRQALAQKQTKCPRCGEVNPAEIHTCSPQVAQPEQKPVAWITFVESFCGYPKLKASDAQKEGYVPVYTAPSKQWVGLTEDEMTEIWEKSGWYVRLFESVEAKLKEKNT